MNKHYLSFLFLRLGIAISMFGHGLVRLPKISKFAEGTAEQFSGSFLPELLVRPFGYFIPIAEFTIGLLLLLGLFTRKSLIAGAVLMLLLMLGTTFIENWNALPSQMIHLAFFAILLIYVDEYNRYSLDVRRQALQNN